MSWEKVALSEVADFSNGVNFDKSAYSSGVKLIGVSNFGNRFSPDYDELQEIDANVVRPGDYLIDGDIVFVRSNGNKELVGRCMLIKEPQYAVTYSGFCIRARIKDTRKHNPTFFAYYFKSKAFRKALSGNAIGANIQNLSQGRLSNHIACVPDIEIQRKIAGILSAYDSLIENNQKQIKLLEEAAQRLYKEWFIDLRFPGHETTPITDGIPEGWNLTNINAVMTFHRGYDLTKNNMIHGKYPVVGSTSIIGYHNQYKVHGPGIITGRSGSLGEYQLIWEDYWPHNTSLYVSDMKDHHVLYLYSMLQTVDFSGLNNGGAIPTLNRNTLSNIPVVEAPKALQNEYVQIVEPVYSAIRNTKKQIKYLQEARDRLLPKLMNGEIEV